MARGAVESRVRERLRSLEARHLLRALRSPSGLDLSSNDYLCLAQHPRIVEAFVAGAAREGCGSTGSRLLRGERDAFSMLEARFASFKGAERALFFSSGYLANLAVLSTLPEPGDVIFSDALNHASLIDGVRLSRAERVVFPHADAGALASLLTTSSGTGARFIVTESLFSMDGDEAPLKAYAALASRHGATLIVDEAHAVGVCGARGTGLVEEHGLDHGSLVTINTAGKALGVGGAFVAGPGWAIEYLLQRARPFVFSTAPPPAMAPAIDVALALVREEPERRARLLARAAHLRRRLREVGVAVPEGRLQIVPVPIGENQAAVTVAAALQQQGFDVRAIRPPTVPDGTARLRLSVNVGIPEAVLERLVDALAESLRHASCSVASS